MIARNVSFDDIYDLAVTQFLDSVRNCYAATGTIDGRWNPVPGRFKDYIATPKFDKYQSLHTTVLGPGGRPVELQSDLEMDRRSDMGWPPSKYEEDMVAHAVGQGAHTTGSKQDEALDIAWLRQLVDWQWETEDPRTFLDSLRFDLRPPKPTCSPRAVR